MYKITSSMESKQSIVLPEELHDYKPAPGQVVLMAETVDSKVEDNKLIFPSHSRWKVVAISDEEIETTDDIVISYPPGFIKSFHDGELYVVLSETAHVVDMVSGRTRFSQVDFAWVIGWYQIKQ